MSYRLGDGKLSRLNFYDIKNLEGKMKHRVNDLFSQGKTQAEICRLTKIPRSTVSRWLNEKMLFSNSHRMRPKNKSVIEKIQNRYIPEPNSGCWIWLGNVKKNGYGSLTIGEKNYYAHRLAFEVFIGEVPEGLVLDHKCRLKCCCNPSHLEPVTQKENFRRGTRWKEKGKL